MQANKYTYTHTKPTKRFFKYNMRRSHPLVSTHDSPTLFERTQATMAFHAQTYPSIPHQHRIIPNHTICTTILADENSIACGSKLSTASQSLMLSPTEPAAYQTPVYMTYPSIVVFQTNNQTNTGLVANQTLVHMISPHCFFTKHTINAVSCLHPDCIF